MNAAAMRVRVRGIQREIAGPADLLLGVRMVGWALLLRVLKYLVPLPSLVRMMRGRGGSGREAPDRERQVITLARWACRLIAWSRGGNCLERGLVTYRYLSAIGSRPTLAVGVGRSVHKVRGHAWVLLDGQPVNETAASLRDFETVITFGPDGES